MILKMLAKPTRYLDLKFDPLNYPGPVKLALRPEFMAMALCATALAAKDEKTIPYSAAGCAFGMAMTANSRKMNEVVNGVLFDDKIINKKPSEEEIVGSFEYRDSAHVQFKGNLFYGVIDSAFLAGGLALDQSFTICAFAALTANNLSASYTFKKLAKGDYAFVKEPPKEEALDHLKSKVPEIRNLPAPQAA